MRAPGRIGMKTCCEGGREGGRRGGRREGGGERRRRRRREKEEEEERVYTRGRRMVENRVCGGGGYGEVESRE